MTICHSKGNLDTDGCCHVAGRPCPLRLKVVDGKVLEGPDLVDRGTVAQFVQRTFSGSAARNRAADQIQGVTYLCRAALEVIAANPALLLNRSALNAAWDIHAQYVALVRPEWAKIEESLGLPAGSYQCSTWRGIAGDECCFKEDAATNTAKRSGLSATAVSIRTAGGT